MPRYQITVPVIDASGYQTWEVDADDKKAAVAAYNRGDAELTGEEVEVTKTDHRNLIVDEVAPPPPVDPAVEFKSAIDQAVAELTRYAVRPLTLAQRHAIRDSVVAMFAKAAEGT